MFKQGLKKCFLPANLSKISREYLLLRATFIIIISIDSNDSVNNNKTEGGGSERWGLMGYSGVNGQRGKV